MKMNVRTLCGILVLSIISSRLGAQWTQANGPYGGRITSFAVTASAIFVSAEAGGVFRSTNNGATWDAVNTGLPLKNYVWFNALAVSGGDLFVATSNGAGTGVYRSSDNGAHWIAVNSGLGLPENNHKNVNCLAVSGRNLFAGTDNGIYTSSDQGNNWTPMNDGLPASSFIVTLAACGERIFAVTNASGVFLSKNNGGTWREVNTGLEGQKVQAITASSTDIFAGTNNDRGGGSVFRWEYDDTSWAAAPNLSLPNSQIHAMTVSGICIFAGMDRGIYRSTDNGGSWVSVNTGLPYWFPANALAACGDTLFAGAAIISGVYRSTNYGDSWRQANEGITGLRITAIARSSTHLLAATDGGLFRRTNNGADWERIETGITGSAVNDLVVSGTDVFAGTGGGVYRSSNGGADWISVSEGLPDGGAYVLTCSGNSIFAGTQNGIYAARISGSQWTVSNTGLPGTWPRFLKASGTMLFAGFYNTPGIFRSTNGGVTWTSIRTGLPPANVAAVFASADTNLFVGMTGNGVYHSSDNGTTWHPAGLDHLTVHSLAVSGRNIFAGTDAGVFLSADNGAHWRSIGGEVASAEVQSLFIDGADLYAGTRAGMWIRPFFDLLSVTLASPADGATGVETTSSLTWNASVGAASYQLQVSTDTSFSHPVVEQIGITSTTFVVGVLASNTTYYWRVRAFNAGETSAWSAIRRFTTLLGFPGAPVATFPADRATDVPINPTLMWNAALGAVSYIVTVSTNSNLSDPIVSRSGITATSFAVSGLANNTKYYWCVWGVNARGASAWPTFPSFTTTKNVITVSGTVVYDNVDAAGIGFTTVTLAPAAGTVLTVMADTSGAFVFPNVPSGEYTLSASKTGDWVGANSTDALQIVRTYAGLSTLDTLASAAGDVNASGSLNATDALMIVQRFTGVIKSFPRGDWTFGTKPVSVGSMSLTGLIVKGLAAGDVNRSNKGK